MNVVLGAVVVVYPAALPLAALLLALLLAGIPMDQSLGVVLSMATLAACGMAIGSLVSDLAGLRGTRRAFQLFGASVVLAAMMTDGVFWTLVSAASDQVDGPGRQTGNLIRVASSATALLAKTTIILSAATVGLAAPVSMLGRVYFPEFREVLNALVPIGVIATAFLLLSYIIEGLVL